MSNYITEIKINKVRHLENLSIKLGDEKKHLILTGKNGSGKTSVLEELDKFFTTILNDYENSNVIFSEEELKSIIDNRFKELSVSFSPTTDIFNQICNYVFHFKDIQLLYSYFSAKRTTNNMQRPNGIEKIDLSKIKNEKLNQYFLKYIVALKAERSFAKDDSDNETVAKIDSWFNTFEEMLKQIFNDDSLELQFDRRNIMSYNFLIKRNNRELFDFTTLSDGYSAIIDIVTELLLKIETTKMKSFDVEGIVLIDEVETHLHVEMQKNIMPLLTSFFPNIQFIVTTHSPFVMSSLSNAIVCDLEQKIIVEDLSGYSYEEIIESYFDSDKYSQEVKEKLKQFEELSNQTLLNENERDEYNAFKRYFKNLPKFMADELAVKINEILLNDLNKR